MDGASVAKLPADLKSKVDAAVAVYKAAAGRFFAEGQPSGPQRGCQMFANRQSPSLRSLGGLAASVATVTGEKSPETRWRSNCWRSRATCRRCKSRPRRRTKGRCGTKSADAVRNFTTRAAQPEPQQRCQRAAKGDGSARTCARFSGAGDLPGGQREARGHRHFTHVQPRFRRQQRHIASGDRVPDRSQERDKVIEAIERRASELLAGAQTVVAWNSCARCKSKKAKALSPIL